MIEISVNKLKKDFGYKKLLVDISFEIMTKERIGLIGNNGSGKTTIFKIISGEENADEGNVFIRKDATIGFLEQIPNSLKYNKIVKEILLDSFSYVLNVEKELRDLELSMSYDNFNEKLMKKYEYIQNKYISLGGYELEERLGRIITGLSLEKLLNKNFNILSGGEKTIVRLATILLKYPDILLLDEPTNHLDYVAIKWLESFLTKYLGTVIIISHDRSFLDKTTNKTICLENGKSKTYYGNYTFFQTEEEKNLIIEFEKYKNQQKQINALKEAIKRFRDWGSRGDNPAMFKKASSLEKRLEKIDLLNKPKGNKKIELKFISTRSGNDVLTFKNLHLKISEKTLLKNIYLSIKYGDKICICGENGSGKTTLIKSILGIHNDFNGEIIIGANIKIGYIPQEIEFSNPNITVIESFRNEIYVSESDARNILSKYFFYGDSVFKKVMFLSGGERIFLKLAILSHQEINFLILDEPTNHIDLDSREILEETLISYKHSILFVSHDRYFINKVSTKSYILKDQNIIPFNPFE